jgi:hypothetical protein
MAVGMQQLPVVGRVRTASAAPDPMVDLAVFLCDSPRLAADHASSLLFLPEIFDPTAACQRLGQLPAQPCFQVRFPPPIVAIDAAANLHLTNDPHLRCRHRLNRPALAFLVSQRAGEDPVAVTLSLEVFLLDPLPALVPMPSPAPAPRHWEDPMIHVRNGALARRITVIHGPALDLLIQTPDQFSCRQAARAVDGFLNLG